MFDWYIFYCTTTYETEMSTGGTVATCVENGKACTHHTYTAISFHENMYCNVMSCHAEAQLPLHLHLHLPFLRHQPHQPLHCPAAQLRMCLHLTLLSLNKKNGRIGISTSGTVAMFGVFTVQIHAFFYKPDHDACFFYVACVVEVRWHDVIGAHRR